MESYQALRQHTLKLLAKCNFLYNLHIKVLFTSYLRNFTFLCQKWQMKPKNHKNLHNFVYIFTKPKIQFWLELSEADHKLFT